MIKKLNFKNYILFFSIGFTLNSYAKEYLLELSPQQSVTSLQMLKGNFGVYKLQKSFQAFSKDYVVIDVPDQGPAEMVLQELMGMGFEKAEVNHSYALFAGAQPPAPPQDLRDFNPKPILPNDKAFTQLWGMLNYGQKIIKESSSSESGVRKMDSAAAQAWNFFRGTREMVVGIMDTGVDYRHEDLVGNLWSYRDSKGQIAYGYNANTQGSDVMDGHSHGTHVAGTIGAVGNNGKGVVGVNWEVSMASVQIFDAKGMSTSDGILRGMDWFYQKRSTIKLINHSWGGSGYSDILHQAFRSLDRAGVINVIAAGNNGKQLGSNGFEIYPAMFELDNSIVVAAHDIKGQRAGFSNFGENFVDVAAPGVDVYSSVPKNLYGLKSGTSMAAPHVTGAVALYWGRFPTLSASAVKRHVLESALTTSTLRGVSKGSKRLNALNLFN